MAMKGAKCTCGPANFIWLIIASIVIGISVYLLVSAIGAQWNGGSTWAGSGWFGLVIAYALSALVWAIGKLCKWKAMSSCQAHCR